MTKALRTNNYDITDQGTPVSLSPARSQAILPHGSRPGSAKWFLKLWRLSSSGLLKPISRFCGAFVLLFIFSCQAQPKSIYALTNGPAERAYLVCVLVRIAEPVLSGMASGNLQLPSHEWEQSRVQFAKLEALGRTLAGIAPWLELGPDQTEEGRTRNRLIQFSVKAIAQSTDPNSRAFLNFTEGGQSLVDTAFLSQALLRAPHQLWERLDLGQRSNVVAALKSSRVLKAGESNWLLFPAMVEAALWEFTGECDQSRIEYAVKRHMEWYKGDGTYGDGAEFHWDYYNSYVIQPMLLEVLRVCREHHHPLGGLYETVLARARRYAAVQERMISPEATFPVIGRSSTYRFGAFQDLSLMALLHELPSGLKPAAVREALTSVIQRMIEAPETFDKQGWLMAGVAGYQPSLRESYISTGSLYLCTEGLLHLGLAPNDPFWTDPPAPWTQQEIWSGKDVPADHAYKEQLTNSERTP